MPNTPNASFIPKQGPVRKVRQTASRQVHLLTIVSYVLFTSTLVAASGVFLYNRHLNSQLDVEVQKLSSTIGGFSDTDMETVREFNIRLHQAQGRLDKSISLSSVFDALEEVTLKSAQITELSIKRNDDTQVLVDAKVNTDSFDESLFQRGVYERNSVVKNVEIKDVTLVQGTDKNANSFTGVNFVAKMIVPLKDIPYKTADLNVVPKTDTQVATSTQTDVSTSTRATTNAATTTTKNASSSNVKR
jgi:hypothetical protein